MPGFRLSWVRALLLTLAGLLLTSGAAWAQDRGRHDGGFGHASGFGFGDNSSFTHHGASVSGINPNNIYGSGFSRGMGYRPNFGRGYLYGRSINGAASASYGLSASKSPGADRIDYGKLTSKLRMPLPPQSGKAHLLVIVPENAELFFNGARTKQTGSQREFVTPALTPGKDYNYDVKASWNENGETMEQTRTVHVQANSRQTIDLTKAEPAAKAEK